MTNAFAELKIPSALDDDKKIPPYYSEIPNEIYRISVVKLVYIQVTTLASAVWLCELVFLFYWLIFDK